MLSHQDLNKKMNLFETFEKAGSGHIFWKPRGYVLYNELCKWLEKIHIDRGYQFVKTPTIYKVDLWKQSGHYSKYKEYMYFLNVDNEKYGIKPMNCPAHILIYKSQPKSYRDLPLRMFEFGYVHRHELSGVLNGLFRVRSFTQDDAHIFCSKEDIMPEVSKVLELIELIFNTFDLKKKYYLSTMPKKHLGTKKMWDYCVDMLKQALEKNNIEYEIKEGEGAFYGAKIDVGVIDSQGREWQLSTIQLDFNLPERFDVNFINKEGKKERAIMIHRAILGSIERFIGILLEHYQGWLPLWLIPEQLRIIPISDKNMKYAQDVYKSIKKVNKYARVSIDKSNDTLNKKIRNALTERVPCAIVGFKEEMDYSVKFRFGNKENKYKLYDLINLFQEY